MTDPKLVARLHSFSENSNIEGAGATTGGSHYLNEIDRQIKMAVDVAMSERRPQVNLLPDRVRRAQLEEEFRRSIHSPELSQQLALAFDIIVKGRRYLDSTSYSMMLAELAKVATHLDIIEVEELSNSSFKNLLKISDESMDSLTKIAIGKYEEGAFPDSFAIYTLLATLSPENTNYWFCVGITAQECEKYELALKAYEVTSLYDPRFIEPRLFAVEYHLKLGEFEDAETRFAEAKIILDDLPLNEKSDGEAALVSNIEILINNHSLV
jgi:tetratricopeptide (TPR) repeat protein